MELIEPFSCGNLRRILISEEKVEWQPMKDKNNSGELKVYLNLFEDIMYSI